MPTKGLVPNVVTYTAVISGLSKEGRSGEALRLYNQMIEAGVIPDAAAYSALRKKSMLL